MPFTKVGPNKYVSPSGRHYDTAQVRLFYANGGKFPGESAADEEKTNERVRKGREATRSGSSKGR
jgi:hypothetical protein